MTDCIVPVPPRANFSIKSWHTLITLKKIVPSYDEIYQSISIDTEDWNNYFEHP